MKGIETGLAIARNEINELHKLASQSAENAVDYAIRCGEKLIEVKQEVGHGNFLVWLKDNFNGSERNAQKYIRVALNTKRGSYLEKPESIRQALRQLSAPEGAHVSNNSGENEWYTPQRYIDSARKVMGTIDLDPASSEIANKIVKAKKYYDEETNGLDKKWSGNVWMNPPYAQPLIYDFILKLETEHYTQAIVLVNNATETKWGQKLIELSNAVCFHTGRIRFVSPDGELGDAPLQGQMIAYIGVNYKEFIAEFKQYGICLRKSV